MRSSVISSSLKMTSSRMVRSPVCSWSPSWITFLATSGVREIDLMTASLPRSMRRAISTSPSRVSSGTVPISRRYMRTGSLVLSSAPGVRSSSSSSAPSAVRSIGLLVAQVLLVRVDDLDAGAAEGVEQVVELVGRGDLRRQQLVHFVVQQVALLLADVDELPYFVVFFFNRHHDPRRRSPTVSSSMRCASTCVSRSPEQQCSFRAPCWRRQLCSCSRSISR